MRTIAIAVAVLALALGASCSRDEAPPKPAVVPPAAPTPPAARAPQPPAASHDDGDPVITAALEYARSLEIDSRPQAREIYEQVIQRYPTTSCEGGPVGFQCADEARRRLRVLGCLDERGEPKTEADSAALAGSIVQALGANDRAALVARASCDFLFGVCHSDVGANDVPDGPLACLAKIAGTSAQVGAAVDASSDWATYPLSSKPKLTLLLERSDESEGWTWSGLCYESNDRDPCATK
jgi:hypothetical protein